MSLIYRRYLFRTFFARFSVLIILFFLFHILLDFAINVKMNFSSSNSIQQIFHYYLFEILQKLEILIPLSFVLSLVQTLFYLNSGFELIAFQVCGLSKQKLLKPIAQFSWFLTLLLFFNSQVLLPKTQPKAQAIKNQNKTMIQGNRKENLFHKSLSDHSILIYSKFDPIEENFHDVYWMKSENIFWHFAKLEAKEGTMLGYLADEFQRSKEGGIRLIQSITEISLFEMDLIEHEEKKDPPSLEFLSFTQLLLKQLNSFEKRALIFNQIQSRFWHKMALPFFPPLLFYLFSIPCAKFSRYKKSTKMLGIAALTFVTFFTLLNALSILSEHHILPAYLASFGPFMLCGFPGLYYYYKA